MMCNYMRSHYFQKITDAQRMIYLARINYKGLVKIWRYQAKLYLLEARGIRQGKVNYV